MIIRTLATLTAPTRKESSRFRGEFGRFQESHFCDRAADGTPINSSHTLYADDLNSWIGQVFKEFPDEPWQISLCGSFDSRGAWDDFDVALANLWGWHVERLRGIQEWRSLYSLPPIEIPSGTLARQGDRCFLEYQQINLLVA